jgi:hypothetical protein
MMENPLLQTGDPKAFVHVFGDCSDGPIPVNIAVMFA